MGVKLIGVHSVHDQNPPGVVVVAAQQRVVEIEDGEAQDKDPI
jgi:hypothetical protein